MTHSFPTFAVLALLFVKPGDSKALTPKKPTTEKEKIEALIKHLEDLKDAKFVRNGMEYDAKSAAKFVRGKWESNEKEIKTAKDFIKRAASESATSGKPYLIRFKDGKETKSGEYMLAELKKLEKPADEKRGT